MKPCMPMKKGCALTLLKEYIIIYYALFRRFGKHYELPLLLQSVVMIFTMLVMVHICVQVKLDKSTVARRLKGVALAVVNKELCPVETYTWQCFSSGEPHLRHIHVAFFK